MSTTPNMGLVLPDASSTVGPTYAQLLTNIGGALYTLDSHNHAPGSGVKVPSAGLNINADLPANGFSLTTLLSAAFSNQSADPSGVCRLYFKNGEFFATDNAGNHVQMTLGGVVNTGSSGNISGLASPASASYSSVTKTFQWNQAANQRANLDCANVQLHRGAAAGENGITVTPPTSLASAYTLTLPTALPGGSLYSIVSDATGALSFSQLVDGTTLSNSGTAISVATGGVGTTQLATNAVTTVKITDGNVTRAKLAAVGQQVSTSCGNFSITSASYVDVTNLSVSITTTGRPVICFLQGTGVAYVGVPASAASLQLAFNVSGVGVFAETLFQGPGGTSMSFPAAFQAMAIVSAGTYTLKVQAKISAGTGSLNNVQLVAYEL